MSNVVGFKGTVPVVDPYPGLIEVLESLLDRAKSGDLRGLGYVTVSANNVIGTGWDGADGTRYPLGSGILILNSRYAACLQHED